MAYSEDMSPNEIKIYELQQELTRVRNERDALVQVLIKLGLTK